MSRVTLRTVIDFLERYKIEHPAADKAEIQTLAGRKFGLSKKRSVYQSSEFYLRFCEANQASFSNVVLSLSALKECDDKPFVVCIVRPSGLEFLLSNTTLLKKISHSSHKLRIDNIRGSFLGHDIHREFEKVPNKPANFERLFARHKELGWAENIKRLVAATDSIVPTGQRHVFSASQRLNILAAPQLAATLSSRLDYLSTETELTALVAPNRDAILKAAQIDNVNLRGNAIEQILTKAANFHALDDIVRSLEGGLALTVDIKTKLLNLTSSPKGYNIDKALELLARGNAAFSFFFVGIDSTKGTVSTRLVSILDSKIIDATRVQFHWAGRESRGVTQLTGDLSWVFQKRYIESVDVPKARNFLKQLIGTSES